MALKHQPPKKQQAPPASSTARVRGRVINLEQPGYMRLVDVLAIFPISRAAWYDGVKRRLYPAPVQVGARSMAYRVADIKALFETLDSKKEKGND